MIVKFKNKEVIREIATTVFWRQEFGWLKGKTVLVTGASGLLGVNIVNTLLQEGRDIDIHIQVQTEPYYTELQSNLTVHYANLANASDCARLPNADVIISAASYAQPLRFLAQPLTALRASGFGLMALLEKCNVGGRFLYISSSEVYCDSHATPPYKESDIGTITPYHPRACYIIGKIFGEALVNLYRNRGISTVAVRPGIIYGPGTKPGDKRSWAAFIERAILEKKIILLDKGLVKRTFCYMTDGIELVFKALIKGTQPVYNISGKSTLTIADLAKEIGEIAKVPVIVPKTDDGIAGTPQDLSLDTSLIENEFNKTVYDDLNYGLHETITWMRRHYD
jgi:nucleoside-diphosphate-sugar epimerase